MLWGLLWESSVLPTALWLQGWVRRGQLVEEVFCWLVSRGFLIPSFLPLNFCLSWAKSLAAAPASAWSLIFSFFLLRACLRRVKGVWLTLGFEPQRFSLGRATLEGGLLHGQSRRWGPLEFFVRWWAVVVCGIIQVGVDTNRAPHDYWLLNFSGLYPLLF